MAEGRYRAAIVGAKRGLHHWGGYAGLEDRATVVALAEVDPERRAALFAELIALGAQAWLTGTEERLFAPLGGQAQFFRVREGVVAPR